MWLWMLSVAFAASPECPLFLCEVLPITLCANITNVEDKIVVLNSLGCGTRRGCNLEDIAEGLKQNISASYDCDLFAINFTTNPDSSEYCPNRKSQKNLVEGSHPKFCEKDEDCKLGDGSYASCTCGLARFKVCQPDVNDQLYISFWDYCDQNENKITDTVSYLWGYYYYNYVTMMSAPTCADDVLVQLWMLAGGYGALLQVSSVLLALTFMQ